MKAGITREAYLMKQLRYEGVLSIYPLVRYRGKGFCTCARETTRPISAENLRASSMRPLLLMRLRGGFGIGV